MRAVALIACAAWLLAASAARGDAPVTTSPVHLDASAPSLEDEPAPADGDLYKWKGGYGWKTSYSWTPGTTGAVSTVDTIYDDDRLQGDEGDRPPRPPLPPVPSGKRWRVEPRLLPVTIGGTPAAFLYRGSIVETKPGESGADAEIVRLVTGNVTDYHMTSGANMSAFFGFMSKSRQHGTTAESELADESTTTTASQPAAEPSTTRAEVLHTSRDLLHLYNKSSRVRGRVQPAGAVEFRKDGYPFAIAQLPALVPATPLLARIGLAGLTPVGTDEVEPEHQRFQSMDVPIRYVSASGTEAAPVFTEIDPDDAELGFFKRIDYENHLADEMAEYARLAPGRPLTIFLLEDPDARVAHTHTLLPIRDRQDTWNFRAFDIPLIGGSVERMQEPTAVIVFPKHHATIDTEEGLIATMKHELGHVLQGLRATIRFRGYRSSFGAHNLSLKTNDSAAFVEGFAEFTAYKFRDTNSENDLNELNGVLTRSNENARKDLLAFYWQDLSSKAGLKQRLPAHELRAVEMKLFNFYGENSTVPRIADFKKSVVAELTGKGQPPLTKDEVEREVASHEGDNPQGFANIRSEELTPEEQKEMQAAHDRLLESQKQGANTFGTVKTAGQDLEALTSRSPRDMMMSEGVIARLLLVLDARLTEAGIDFYRKVLDTLDKDPYEGKSEPPQPTNFKELLALMDRDPELHGKIFPIVTSASGGVLTEKEFVLAASRQEDPLSYASPGLPDYVPPKRRSADPGSYSTKPAIITPVTTGTRVETPADDPDFGDLRAK